VISASYGWQANPSASKLGVRSGRDSNENEGAQDVHRQRVALEAVAAPAARNQLVFERVRVEEDRQAELDIQVLERDRRGVRPVKPSQRGKRGRVRAAAADAGEAGRDVHVSNILRTAQGA
jgi:hypothetical protein